MHVIFTLVVVEVTYAWDDDLVHAILTKVTSGCVHNWDVIIKTSLILCFYVPRRNEHFKMLSNG